MKKIFTLFFLLSALFSVVYWTELSASTTTTKVHNFSTGVMHDAASISFDTTGTSLSETNVQTAIAKVDTNNVQLAATVAGISTKLFLLDSMEVNSVGGTNSVDVAVGADLSQYKAFKIIISDPVTSIGLPNIIKLVVNPASGDSYGCLTIHTADNLTTDSVSISPVSVSSTPAPHVTVGYTGSDDAILGGGLTEIMVHASAGRTDISAFGSAYDGARNDAYSFIGGGYIKLPVTAFTIKFLGSVNKASILVYGLK